nr:immunoglobulin light chain junction region [Macaca mulatta]
CQQYYSTPYRF